MKVVSCGMNQSLEVSREITSVRPSYEELLALSQRQITVIQSQTVMIERLTTTNPLQEKETESLRADYLAVRFELDQIKRLIFGSKSERFVPTQVNSQLGLFGSGVEVPAPAVTEIKKVEILKPVRAASSKPHPGRNIFPAHLARVVETIEPAEYLAKPEAYTKIGEAVTEELDCEPAKLFVRQYVRPKYLLKEDKTALIEASKIVIADLPIRPIEKGVAGVGLLVQILTDKFIDHLPLYRISKRFKRDGVDISDSTMGDWITQCCTLLFILYERLRMEVLKDGYIQVDETHIDVMDPKTKGKTHHGYYWVYRNPVRRLVWFDYQPSRSGKPEGAILDGLKGYRGYMQNDGYKVYEAFEKQEEITLLCCMAHARRKFFEAPDFPQLKEHALTQFGQLYDVEREARDHELGHEARHGLRQQKSTPVLHSFGQWLKDNICQTTPRSPTGKAFEYAVQRWTKLCAYTTDGKLEIDNNGVENTIRPVAIGRKNYMFAGSHEGAKRAAMLYSFFGTCQQHNVNPREWLTDVLRRIPSHPVNRIEELLPYQWKLSQKNEQ